MDLNNLSDYELVIFNNKMSRRIYDFIKLDRVYDKVVEPLVYTNDVEVPQPKVVKFSYAEFIVAGSLQVLLASSFYDQEIGYRYNEVIRNELRSNRMRENSSLGDVVFKSYPYFSGKMRIDNLGSANRKDLLTAVKEMYRINSSEFDRLWSTLKISEIAKQKEQARVINNKRSKDNRSERFTVPEQKYIAERFMSAILGTNYVAQLAGGQIKAEQLDKSGESIVKALSIFNVSQEKLFDRFATHKSVNKFDDKNAAALRRFILQFSKKDYTALALIDDDELVRLAAEKKNTSEVG